MATMKQYSSMAGTSHGVTGFLPSRNVNIFPTPVQRQTPDLMVLKKAPRLPMLVEVRSGMLARAE